MKILKKQLYIYVSGPYRGKSSEGTEFNRKRADSIGQEIALRGHIPFIPHTMLDPWQNKDVRFTHEIVSAIDQKWLGMCDALFHIAPSQGADRELQYAKRQGKMIFTKLEKIPDLR